MKRFRKIFAYSILVLLCLEIALQIYNPFSGRVKNGEIILPINTSYEIDLPSHPGMDTHIKHHKNSLGFRGPELTDSNATKVLCLGGSTTECFYLSDGKDWPSVLGKKLTEKMPNIWLNNAGMDGQSSFGHLQFLKQYGIRMKPDYIILMCGLNDMSLDTPGRFDEPSQSWFSKAYNFLELPSTIRNIIRSGKAKQAGLNHQFINDIHQTETLEMPDSTVMSRLETEQRFLPAYKKRLVEIIKLCKENHIKLIFVAQSILFSDEKDLFSNVYLGNIKTGEINGKTRAYILKMYNKITFDLAEEENLPFINLAARLPKDSRFFYDGYHFTNDGAEMTAGILFDEIVSKQLIQEKSNGNHP